MWEDVKFDLHHFAHIERLALVGESRWEAGMAVFCKPFTTAKVRYFDESKADEASTWIHEGSCTGRVRSNDYSAGKPDGDDRGIWPEQLGKA